MLSKLDRNANSTEDDDLSLQRIVDRRRDAERTLTAWRDISKKELIAACTRYELDSTGTKKVMAHRLYCHFRPAGSSSTLISLEGGSPEKSSRREEAFTITTAGQQPTQPIVQVSLEELGALVKDAVSSAIASQEQARRISEPAIPPLSPSSHLLTQQNARQHQRTQEQDATITGRHAFSNSGIGHVAASFMAHGEEADNAGQETGMEVCSTLPANLPPLSVKMHRSIKAREFIDFNSLLPQSLYDLASTNQLVDFQLVPGQNGQETFSLAPKKRPSQRITNFHTWLEAWNIFARVTMHYHPHLAAEILAYQEHICQISRSYPFTAWQCYDTAFRLNLALNKSLSWARTDSYSFDKFLRDHRAQQQPGLCYKCQLPGHLASDCPSAI